MAGDQGYVTIERGVTVGAFFRGARASDSPVPLCSLKVKLFLFSFLCGMNPQWNGKLRCAWKNDLKSPFVSEGQSHSCEWLKLGSQNRGYIMTPS